jgi:hypothetical protein
MSDLAPEERAAMSAGYFKWLGTLIRPGHRPTIEGSWQAAWAAGRAYERQRGEEETARLRATLGAERDLVADILEEVISPGDLPLRWWEERLGVMNAALAQRALADPARAEDTDQ